MSARLAKSACCVGLVAAALLWPPAGGVTHAETGARYVKVKNLPPGRVLLIRVGPSRTFMAIGFLPHNARHIRNYGCKRLATGRWCELRYRGTRGWSSERYLAADRARRA